MHEGIELMFVDGEVYAIADSLSNALDFWIEIHTIGEEWTTPVSIWLDGELWASTRSLVEILK